MCNKVCKSTHIYKYWRIFKMYSNDIFFVLPLLEYSRISLGYDLLQLMDFIGDPQTLAIHFRIILIFTICFSCKRIKSETTRAHIRKKLALWGIYGALRELRMVGSLFDTIATPSTMHFLLKNCNSSSHPRHY